MLWRRRWWQVAGGRWLGGGTPGGTAVHSRRHPDFSLTLLVWKVTRTVPVLLVRSGGRSDPQVLAIRGVPSPSVMVRWSSLQLESAHTLKAVKVMAMTSPGPTTMVSVLSRLLG